MVRPLGIAYRKASPLGDQASTLIGSRLRNSAQKLRGRSISTGGVPGAPSPIAKRPSVLQTRCDSGQLIFTCLTAPRPTVSIMNSPLVLSGATGSGGGAAAMPAAVGAAGGETGAPAARSAS